MIKKMQMSEERRNELRRNANKVHCNTEQNHLLQIGGWNDGKIHSLISRASGGKSTYCRTVIYDFLKCNPKRTCFVWLSEISTEDFEEELSFWKNSEELQQRLYCYSEMDNLDSDMTLEDRLIEFKEVVGTSDCDFVIFDNVTTSQLYEGMRPATQGKVLIEIKQLCKQMRKPFLLIAHVGGGFKNDNDFIEMNDVRGSKHIVNLAEFFFILQSFHINKSFITTIRPTKYRGKIIKEHFFTLPFNSDTITYMRDIPVNFEEFKEIWKMRNKK